MLNNSPVDNSGFPKTSEVEFRGFLGDPEVTEPAGETAPRSGEGLSKPPSGREVAPKVTEGAYVPFSVRKSHR